MNFLNTNPTTVSIALTEDTENIFEFIATLPFTFAFDSESEASEMGFTCQKLSLDNLRYYGNNILLRAQYPNWFKSNIKLMNNGRDNYIYKVLVTFTFYPLDRKMKPTKKIMIDKYYAFSQASELANFIKNEEIKAKCLKDCYYDENKNRICLTVADVVYKFKLLNNLS